MLALAVIAASIVYYARLSTVFMIAMTLSAVLMLYAVGLVGAALLPVSNGQRSHRSQRRRVRRQAQRRQGKSIDENKSRARGTHAPVRTRGST